MKPVVLLFGPTASGKTSLALALARDFNGEIVSADSMQIYRGMDIGTAKATEQERSQIPHHCIDLCDIRTSFSVAEWRAHALSAIQGILERGHLPIVVGGTGLYFDALLYRPTYGDTAADDAVRVKLRNQLETEGALALHEALCKIDPVTGNRLHPNDTKRVMRALEIHTVTGKLPSDVMHRERNTDFNFLSFFLNYPERESLYRACDQRAEEMFRIGLPEETRALLEQGLEETPTAAQAIGYKELIPYLRGECSEKDALAEIQKRTRNYAKRQITWFSKSDAVLLPAGNADALSLAQTHLREFLKGSPC